jgi:DNA repair protein RecN (Recombination protein N)
MIRELVIRNMALIDKLSIEFSSGLTVLTGETGAGKSILLGAIGLVLGDRAFTEVIRSGAQAADVCATFTLESVSDELRVLCDENDVGIDDSELIIRRVISRGGRNRTYVNQTPVPLSFVKALGDCLVDLHGQHDHQSLLKQESARAIIDSLPGVASCKKAYDERFAAWIAAREALADHDRTAKELAQKRDFIEFQHQELAELSLEPNEEATLEKEFAMLSSAEERLRCVADIGAAIEGGESAESLERRIARIRKNLETLRRHDDAAEPWIRDIEAVQSALSELLTFCAEYMDSQSAAAAPARLETINGRLAKIQRLKKKHDCSFEQLLALRDSLADTLAAIAGGDSDRGRLAAAAARASEEATVAAAALSRARAEHGARFDARITARMAKLGFADGAWRTSLIPCDQPGAHGAEEVLFEVRANPGEPFLPLAKSASGGEISRLMLAIKSVMAEQDAIPVLIFDEIDTGIGGMLAKEVAAALKELSASHQVLCISHLHQIASVADHHFRVAKSIAENRTVTRVTPLTDKEKVTEISRMLGDESTISRLHAEELVKGSRKRDA